MRNRRTGPSPKTSPFFAGFRRSSSIAASGVSFNRASIVSCASMRLDRRSPLWAFGRASPCWRSRWPPAHGCRTHSKPFLCLRMRCAAFTAARTRTRRSCERAFDMPCRPPLPAGSLNQLTADLGIPFDSLSSANALAGRQSGAGLGGASRCVPCVTRQPTAGTASRRGCSTTCGAASRSLSQVSPRNLQYWSARSRSARRPAGSTTSS
jgi:hypothetical protein